jgi:hypothetical protein
MSVGIQYRLSVAITWVWVCAVNSFHRIVTKCRSSTISVLVGAGRIASGMPMSDLTSGEDGCSGGGEDVGVDSCTDIEVGKGMTVVYTTRGDIVSSRSFVRFLAFSRIVAHTFSHSIVSLILSSGFFISTAQGRR